MKERKITLKLRTRVILLMAVFLVAMNVALGMVLMWQARNSMKELLDGQMLGTVNTAADLLDGDALEEVTQNSNGTPGYESLNRILTVFQDNTGLTYVYTVRETEDGSFIMLIDPADSDVVDDEVAEFGEPVESTEALRSAAAGVAAVENEPYGDRFGMFYSAYSPVFNSEGEVAGIVGGDFDVSWYEEQMSRNTATIIFACVLFIIIGIIVIYILTRQYTRQMDSIQDSLKDLSQDLDALTQELTENGDAGENGGREQVSGAEHGANDIPAMEKRIHALRDDLRQYISHASTQANSMITAMASDYRAVYYISLDDNEGVCYRGDPNDEEQSPEGTHFPYLERFTYYAELAVTESYREDFLRFIDPDNIRKNLANQPIIAFRYLAKRGEREYYEMIRMAGVRRPEDRDDHIVHAIGLGLTEIDAEMRDTMAKNEALVEALAMAEEANVAKTAFLSNMSHEIRTPMNAIIGLDSLALHDESLKPQTRDYLEKIGGSAHHLLNLINDILDMSRIESGRLVLRNEEFSFSVMLEQINTMVMSQCGDKGLTYECRILSHVDNCYIGDDMKLKEVLLNILSNAIKFTDAPGSVTMTVEQVAKFETQSTLKFCIKDTGIGMDKEFIPKIFDPFSQADSTRKNKYGSTGLGMAITKNIVDMMNGSISIESEKGVGTEFTVVVTLRSCEHQETGGENIVDPHRLHVLVVDDEEIVAESTRMILDEAGIRTDICTGGQAALQMMEVQHVKQEPYNLVLIDWRMPEMDGLETTRQIRALYGSDETVIILTGYSLDEIPKDAMAAGADSILVKPFTAASVVAALERIIHRGSLELFHEKKRAELEGRRILLAEDIELNAEIMMDILSMRDVEADHAENGKIAVEMFEKSEVGTYAAILMDVRMPEMDGLEAAAAIRALNRPDAAEIPIIALTANAFDEDVQRSLQAGMNAHLNKPVEADHLFQTLEELIYEAEN